MYKPTKKIYHIRSCSISIRLGAIANVLNHLGFINFAAWRQGNTNQQIYFLNQTSGGYSGGVKNSIETYEGSSDSFVMSLVTMPTGIYGLCIVSISEEVFYFVAGAASGNGPGNQLYKWQRGVSWQSLAPLQKKRTACGCALIKDNQEIVAAGGVTTGWGPTNTVEIYNIAENSWRQGKELPLNETSFFVYENTLWALGEGDKMTYKYDYEEDQWTHMDEIIMGGVPSSSQIVLDVDDTLKCS